MNRSTIITLSFVALYLAFGMAPVTLLVGANYVLEPAHAWTFTPAQDAALTAAHVVWSIAALTLAVKVTGINRLEVTT